MKEVEGFGADGSSAIIAWHTDVIGAESHSAAMHLGKGYRVRVGVSVMIKGARCQIV